MPTVEIRDILVIRRVGGLEVRGILHRRNAGVIRRVGGLEAFDA